MGCLTVALWVGVCVILQLLWPDTACAWGPGVHMVSALSVLRDVKALSPSIASIISSCPREYLYGCLSADFFVGKSTGKQTGYPHTWEGGFTFLDAAADDRRQAFAYGFLSHLAADVVAHHFYIPSLIDRYRSQKRMRHLYWELRADYLMGPVYTRMARELLRMDHQGCDDLLRFAAAEKTRGFAVKKHLYRRSVTLSDYWYTTRDVLSTGRDGRWKTAKGYAYVAYMTTLSCLVVKRFLREPHSSPCLEFNPLGRKSLHLRRRRRLPDTAADPVLSPAEARAVIGQRLP